MQPRASRRADMLSATDGHDVCVRRHLHGRARPDLEPVRAPAPVGRLAAHHCAFSLPRVPRLKERKAFEHQAENKAAAMYAARKVLDALGNMFVNAKNVMDWLNECARDIAQHGASRGVRMRADCARLYRVPSLTRALPCFAESSVRWRTPVGLPVVQVRTPRRACTLQRLRLSCLCASRSRTASAVSAPCRRCFRRSPSRACCRAFRHAVPSA